MLDLITLGTISIDLYFRGEKLPYDKENFVLKIGAKYNADYLYEGIGGGGVNVAAAAIKNGASAAVLGFVGDNPFKKVILQRLNELTISSDFVQTKDEYLNVSSILLTSYGERTIINYRPSYDSLHREDFDQSSLLSASAFYLGNLPDVPITERTKLLSFLKSKDKLIFLNLGTKDCERPHDELNELTKNVEVILLNRYEFAKLAGKEAESMNLEEDIVQMTPILKEKKIIITDSKKGSYGYEGNEVFFQSALEPAQVIDTTGAGDAYTGAFIAEYIKSKDLKQAMAQGAQHASYIISKIGAN